MAGKLRVPRSRGALTGVMLILLGAWGALIPLVGPYFHYAYTPANAWTYSTGRLWLEILPGLGAALGGAVLVASTWRPVAIVGAWFAAICGAWFAIGTALTPLWTRPDLAGLPVGGTVDRAIEQLGFFTGLGSALIFLAAAAIGRLSVTGAVSPTVSASIGTGTAPASRKPLSLAPLRRVVSGKKPAAASAERSEHTAEPAGISS